MQPTLHKYLPLAPYPVWFQRPVFFLNVHLLPCFCVSHFVFRLDHSTGIVHSHLSLFSPTSSAKHVRVAQVPIEEIGASFPVRIKIEEASFMSEKNIESRQNIIFNIFFCRAMHISRCSLPFFEVFNF